MDKIKKRQNTANAIQNHGVRSTPNCFQDAANTHLSAFFHAVNVSLTLRNWMIGCYITEYEQNGANRAKYGDRLLGRLSERLSPKGVSRVEEREPRRYRQFYQSYPQIRETVSPELHQRLLGPLATGQIEKRESATPELSLPGKELIGRLSFSHFAELLQFDQPVQRAFYEVECIRGNWSVRELKR